MRISAMVVSPQFEFVMAGLDPAIHRPREKHFTRKMDARA
jgi:hypothetical protein